MGRFISLSADKSSANISAASLLSTICFVNVEVAIKSHPFSEIHIESIFILYSKDYFMSNCFCIFSYCYFCIVVVVLKTL